jgi:hypothetical protein
VRWSLVVAVDQGPRELVVFRSECLGECSKLVDLGFKLGTSGTARATIVGCRGCGSIAHELSLRGSREEVPDLFGFVTGEGSAWNQREFRVTHLLA